MLSWALTFLVIAIIAGVLGFGGIAGAATDIARVLFFVFLVLFLVGLVLGWGRPSWGYDQTSMVPYSVPVQVHAISASLSRLRL
ncbi:MAG TPA: DUF1328 domain-containing protein [Candidatus Binataceae bacterium]|nr:DUF1328 domain-containing protein [Candidatus Binataceae bacterium]